MATRKVSKQKERRIGMIVLIAGLFIAIVLPFTINHPDNALDPQDTELTQRKWVASIGVVIATIGGIYYWKNIND